MNKNRILFILLISFIAMFGFKLDVYAAQEMTCTYNFANNADKTGGANKVILQQNTLGQLTVYTNSYDVSPSDTSKVWNKTSFGSSYSLDNSVKNATGQLDACPSNLAYISYEGVYERMDLVFVDSNSCKNGTIQKNGGSGYCRSLDSNNSNNKGFLPISTKDGVRTGDVVEKKEVSSNGDSDDSSDDYVKIKFEDNKLLLCEKGKFLGDEKLSELLHSVVVFVKILVPVILLVLGSLDFVQAVFAQDEGAIKKAQGKFIKRLIIAVIIFLIPTFLKVIFDIANSVWGKDFIDASLCGIL